MSFRVNFRNLLFPLADVISAESASSDAVPLIMAF